MLLVGEFQKVGGKDNDFGKAQVKYLNWVLSSVYMSASNFENTVH